MNFYKECYTCNPLRDGWCSQYVESVKGKMLDEKCPRVANFVDYVLTTTQNKETFMKRTETQANGICLTCTNCNFNPRRITCKEGLLQIINREKCHRFRNHCDI